MATSSMSGSPASPSAFLPLSGLTRRGSRGVTSRSTMRTAMLLLPVLSIFAGLAQVPAKNPREGDPDAIRTGMARFQLSCAECHGVDAKGVFGPDLTTLWAAEASEERIFQTVRRGVPGSSMPPSRMPDDEIWATLAYVRTLAPSVPPPPPTGDAQNGE